MHVHTQLVFTTCTFARLLILTRYNNCDVTWSSSMAGYGRWGSQSTVCQLIYHTSKGFSSRLLCGRCPRSNPPQWQPCDFDLTFRIKLSSDLKSAQPPWCCLIGERSDLYFVTDDSRRSEVFPQCSRLLKLSQAVSGSLQSRSCHRSTLMKYINNY